MTLLAPLLGCSVDAPGAPVAQVVDSAGVRVVTYDFTNDAPPTYGVLGKYDLEIGTLDGPAEYAFSEVREVALAEDGSILVTDWSLQEVRVFDPSGTYRHSLGGRGDGPGEFAFSPTIAGLAADTVFAFDRRTRRVTSFTIDGAFLESRTLPSGSGGAATHAVRLRDGTYLAQTRWVPDRDDSETYDFRVELDSIVVEHLSPSLGLLDTVAVMADLKNLRSARSREDGTFSVVQAETPHTTRAFVLTDGVRPLLAHSDAFAVRIGGTAMGPDAIWRVLGVDHPATAAEIRSRQEAAVREQLGPDIDPLTWRLNVESAPERLPSFAKVLVSADGDIWISRMDFNDSEGYEWLVFGPEGELRGAVQTPPGTQLYAVRGDVAFGVTTGELDVPYVRRYPLLPPGG